MSKLVLYPGAFDPFHVGHLAVLRSVLAQMPDEDQLWICPEPAPRGKTDVKPLDKRQRIISTALASIDDPRVSLGQLDTTSEGNFRLNVSFTPLLAENSDISIILGADKYPRVASNWAGIDSARQNGLRFLVANRGDSQIELLHESDRVIEVNSEISSKMVKDAIRGQKPIKHMVIKPTQPQIMEFYP